SHVVNYRGGEPVQAIVIAETNQGDRFVAQSDDSEVIEAVMGTEQPGTPIKVVAGDKGALHFSVADD
ncbi:MAG: hypothetical protein AAGF57_19230, partial [Pseudomonadota bacterium]